MIEKEGTSLRMNFFLLVWEGVAAVWLLRLGCSLEF